MPSSWLSRTLTYVLPSSLFGIVVLTTMDYFIDYLSGLYLALSSPAVVCHSCQAIYCWCTSTSLSFMADNISYRATTEVQRNMWRLVESLTTQMAALSSYLTDIQLEDINEHTLQATRMTKQPSFVEYILVGCLPTLVIALLRGYQDNAILNTQLASTKSQTLHVFDFIDKLLGKL
ncbi:hypothetical protein OF83DRAFT_1088068, partial [Amylostereum chailletii]